MDRFPRMKPALLCAIFLSLAPVFGQDRAQTPLPQVALSINSKSVVAEVADEDAERSAGLMFRTKLDAEAGMLFLMPEVGPAIFWMRNTKIPLSIAFIDLHGRILEIHDMKPNDETPIRSRLRNVAFALEMDHGWFARNSIFPGDEVDGLPPYLPK